MSGASVVWWILGALGLGAAGYYLLRPTSSNGPGCPAKGDAAFEATLADIRTGKTAAATATAIVGSYDGLGCKEAAQAVRDAMAAAGMKAPAAPGIYKGGPGEGALGLAPKVAPFVPPGKDFGGLTSSAPWAGLRTLPAPERAQALAAVAPLNYRALVDGSLPICKGTLVVDLDRMQAVSGYGRPVWADTDDKYLTWLLALTKHVGDPITAVDKLTGGGSHEVKIFPDGPLMKSIPGPACPSSAAFAAFRDHLAYTGVLTAPARADLDAVIAALQAAYPLSDPFHAEIAA